ncbi:MAG: PD40 domain-containing protein [Thermoleophilia bacterium]|nr:PD40 domain-containing protein [Thermoleophilia bacterium]
MVRATILLSTFALALAIALPAGTAQTSARQLAVSITRGGDSEIYVIREDGFALRQLTRNAASDYFPVWSPDGKRLLFVSDRDGDDELYVATASGAAVRQLTRNRGVDTTPAWSPDGRRIVFASNRAGGEHELYVVNADGTSLRRLTNTSRIVMDTTPSWSPDGRWIVFASNRLGYFNMDLYRVRPDGKGLRRLTFTRGSERRPGDEGTPAWSPDGTQIAFSTNRDGQQELYVMAADGKSQRRVTRAPGRDDILPRWSPDGSTIAYLGTPLPHGASAVYVIDPDGSGHRKVRTGSDPSWRP